MILFIENTYSDGHRSAFTYDLAEPDLADLDGWWEDVVYPLTGDGHGAGKDLGSCYTATIKSADAPELVDTTREWVD